jgi:hypothetical protein
MKTTSFFTEKGLLVAVIAGFASGSLHAQVLLNDTFSDNERSTQNLPTSAAWYVGGSSGATTSAATGQLVTTTGTSAGANTNLAAYFTTSGSPQTLLVGETVTLSFSVSFAGASFVPAADAFRFGLFNSGGNRVTTDLTTGNGADAAFNSWTGYSAWVPVGNVTSTSAAIRERTGTSTTLYAGGANPPLATVAYTANTLQLSTTYTGNLSITRNTSNSTISFDLGGVTTSFSDTTGNYFTFDSVAFFGTGGAFGTNGTFTLDNVSVSVVPEPSTALFAGVGIGFLLINRLRRKRGTLSA